MNQICGGSLSKQEHRYILLSAVIVATINLTYFVGWRFGGLNPDFLPYVWVFLSLSLQNILVGFIATTVGVYTGLWIIGKVRIDSPTIGLVVGLLSFVFSVLYSTIPLLLLYQVFTISTESFGVLMVRSLIPMTIEYAVGCLPGGFLGGIVVKRMAPNHCPRCRAELPTGVIYCQNCGWGRV